MTRYAELVLHWLLVGLILLWLAPHVAHVYLTGPSPDCVDWEHTNPTNSVVVLKDCE